MDKSFAVLKGAYKNENFLSVMGSGCFALFEASVLLLMAHTYSQGIFGEWIIFYSGFTLIDRMIFGIGSFSLVKFLSESIDSGEKAKLTGSSWIIQIIIIFALSVLSFSILRLAQPAEEQYGLTLLLLFFPVLALVKLPVNQSLAILQSENRFGGILVLRAAGMGFFVLFLLLNLRMKLDILYVVPAYVLSHMINAFICLFKSWSGIIHLFHFQKAQIRKLIMYGKYSMGTYIGFNILRESDAIIIAFLMTKSDAALFVIPLRLIDILNVPLMGFIAVIVPKISKASSDGDYGRARSIYYRYSGVLTYLFIPLTGLMYLLAPYLIWIFGGAGYMDNPTVLHIFHVLLIYGLILPVDSITGTTLDSINKPQLNFIKVSIMVAINIVGDIWAIRVFDSMVAVAVVTNLNLLSGLLAGLIMLKKELGIKVSCIFSYGFAMIKESVLR